MRTLVTGGGGFIGTNLMKRLLKDGQGLKKMNKKVVLTYMVMLGI